MKLTILGVKNLKTKEIFVAQRYGKGKIPLEYNRAKEVPILGVYPYDTFSSLTFSDSRGTPLEEDEVPCYLTVETDLTNKEYEGMNSAGIMYYEFENRTITPLEECLNPIEVYEKEYLSEKGRLRLDSFVSWCVHEKVKSESEREALLRLIEESFAVRSKTKRSRVNSLVREFIPSIDFSLTKEVLPLVEYMYSLSAKHNVKLTFGQYGTNEVTEEDIREADWSVSTVISLIPQRLIWEYSVLNNKNVTKDNLLPYLKNKDTILSLNKADMNALKAIGVDMKELFAEFLDFSFSEDSFLSDFLNDKNYKPYTSYSTDGYCCEEHDGPYEDYLDEDGNPIEYLVDEQASELNQLCSMWITVLSKEELVECLAAHVDRDVLERTKSSSDKEEQ